MARSSNIPICIHTVGLIKYHRADVLDFSTNDIDNSVHYGPDHSLLGMGSRKVLVTMFSSNPGLYLLDVSSTDPSPVMLTKNSLEIAKCPCRGGVGAKLPQLRSIGIQNFRIWGGGAGSDEKPGDQNLWFGPKIYLNPCLKGHKNLMTQTVY